MALTVDDLPDLASALASAAEHPQSWPRLWRVIQSFLATADDAVEVGLLALAGKFFVDVGSELSLALLDRGDAAVCRILDGASPGSVDSAALEAVYQPFVVLLGQEQPRWSMVDVVAAVLYSKPTAQRSAQKHFRQKLPKPNEVRAPVFVRVLTKWLTDEAKLVQIVEPLLRLDDAESFHPPFDALQLEEAALQHRAWRTLLVQHLQHGGALHKWLPRALKAGQDGQGWGGALAMAMCLTAEQSVEGLQQLRVTWRPAREELAVLCAVAATLRDAGASSAKLETCVVDAGCPAANGLSALGRAQLLVEFGQQDALVAETAALLARTNPAYAEVTALYAQ